VETATWAGGIAGLVAALAGVVMFLVLTGAITRAVAAEVAAEDPSAVSIEALVVEGRRRWLRSRTGCWSGCCCIWICGPARRT
jgi:hypothetical protein